MGVTFLDEPTFEGMFRPLTTAESAKATLILQVTSDWIREQPSERAPLADNDFGAVLVCFEVCRDQLQLGQFSQLGSFQDTTSLRTEAGAFSEAAGMLEEVISDRQKRILGIPLRAAPVSSFPTPCPQPATPWDWWTLQ